MNSTPLLGFLHDACDENEIKTELQTIQSLLLIWVLVLASDPDQDFQLPGIQPKHIEILEKSMDKMDEQLQLRCFAISSFLLGTLSICSSRVPDRLQEGWTKDCKLSYSAKIDEVNVIYLPIGCPIIFSYWLVIWAISTMPVKSSGSHRPETDAIFDVLHTTAPIITAGKKETTDQPFSPNWKIVFQFCCVPKFKLQVVAVPMPAFMHVVIIFILIISLHFITKTVYHANKILPADIVLHQILPMNSDLHARFDAKKRSYIYKLKLRKPIPALSYRMAIRNGWSRFYYAQSISSWGRKKQIISAGFARPDPT